MSVVELEKRNCGGCGEETTVRAGLILGIPVFCRECRKLSGEPESSWMSPYAVELSKRKETAQ